MEHGEAIANLELRDFGIEDWGISVLWSDQVNRMKWQRKAADLG
jgi:hypothetical protein